MADGGATGMIDLRQANKESMAWNISLRDWMELQVRVYGNVDAFGDICFERESDEEWRGRVADVLIQNGLASKANRFLECQRYGVRVECKGPEKHGLFAQIYCDLRFCPRCGGRQFARLIQKYSPVVKWICRNRRRGYRLRAITLTSRKQPKLSSEQVGTFNDDVKDTLKLLSKGVDGWGAIWSDEVGFNNLNLHAHILYYGPYIDQRTLAAAWLKISGHEVVYITKAPPNPAKALLYLLKYVSKPPADDPEIIGQLEVAFHTKRRVHTLGIFYNFVGEDTDHLCSEWKLCPHCGAELLRLPGAVRVEKLIREGRTFIGARIHERKQKWVN